MGTEIILLAVGLALVLLGAEMLVEHASRIARHWGVSEFVIGATVVAFGTSAPEMVVSFIAALEGNSDMAAGNVIGSNILNAALILGLSALLAPAARWLGLDLQMTLLFGQCRRTEETRAIDLAALHLGHCRTDARRIENHIIRAALHQHLLVLCSLEIHISLSSLRPLGHLLGEK